MRIKTDYMGNDQLLPAYNVQLGAAEEYIAVVEVNQYRSDMGCFVPLMNKFKDLYGFYPKYPVADAGYGSYNNYIFCEQNGMEKYMKFPMFKQEEVYQCEDCTGCPYAKQCKKTDRNRSIQVEGTFGIMKQDRWYKRIVRRGMKSVRLEVFLVSIGQNLYKYHNKKRKAAAAT